MENIEIKTGKNMRDGWLSESVIPLGVDTEEGAMQISISTMKRYSGNLVSIASVQYKKPDGCVTFIVFQDYSKAIGSVKVARVTAQACEAAHKAALEKLPEVMAEVKKQYNLA